jgi:DNA-binding winged helix-turn-helix (wHTH) protein/tetratricopeptide (TPR) repeat protein
MAADFSDGAPNVVLHQGWAQSPPTMTSDTLFRFGRREVDAAARSVRLDGQVRAIEPRAFALLLHLIRHRQRVVTKEELLETVWPQEAVSVSALARAVMKARQAIGDDDTPPMIRSVPRVGYRFHATLDHETGPARSPLAPASVQKLATHAQSIALLPFDNATGDPALDWVALGLMAVVAQTLGQHPGLTAVDLPSLLVAVNGARDSGADRVEAVRQATGAKLVVESRVSSTPSGHRLDFQLHRSGTVADGSAAEAAAGSVHAGKPAELGSRMAAELAERLFPGDAVPSAWLAPAADPLATEAYARGLEAMARHQLQQAVHLLRLAVELAPANNQAQVELLRALSSNNDNEALRLARRLLPRADRAGDLLMTSRVQQAVGRLHLLSRRPARADYWLEQSVRLAEGHESPVGLARTLMLQVSTATLRADHARVAELLPRMYRQCDLTGDQILRVAGMNFEAINLSERGELAQSVAVSEEAMRRARALHANGYLIDACDNAAWDLARLGRLQEAATFGEEAVAASRAFRTRDPVESMPAACWAYALARDRNALASLVATMPAPEQAQSPEDVWRCRGLLASCEGRHAEAADCFRTALAMHQEAGHAYNERQTLPWLVDALVLAGQHDQASQLLAAGPRHARLESHLAVQLQHARALLAHAQRRCSEALAQLEQLLARRPAPLWAAWVNLDAAWLHAEAGRPEAGLPLLAAVPAPLADHPLTQATRARLHHAAGDFPAARQCLQGALATLGDAAPAHLLALAGMMAQAGTALPAIPCLPSHL